jgi:hypothetical protein
MTYATPLLAPNTNIEWIPPDAVQHAPLCAAAAYWNRLRGDRSWPSREELSFRDMARLAPYMSLVRVIDDGADFEHRVVGDHMVCAFSVPIQNRRFSDIAVDAPGLIEISFQVFRKVLETRAPVAVRLETDHGGAEMVYARAVNIHFPLGRTEDCIDHIVVFGIREESAAHQRCASTTPTEISRPLKT